MNKIILALIALLSVSIVVAPDAEARRMGGGSSIGKQRSITPQPAPQTPQQAPAASPKNPAQAAPSGASRWLGPLAGLALGAGLASLFFNNGIAGAFGGILMVLLAAAAIMFVFRMLRSRPATPPLQYAGAGSTARPSDFSTHFGGAGPGDAPAASRYPPGFNADEFARHAKLNFTRLQAANDKHDLSTMRDFMTPEMYREITADLEAHGSAPQQTEVVTLNAEVLEVATESSSYIASVRFTGMIRERADGPAEPFSEIWHLEKSLDGSTGWLICGIQQE